MSNEYEEKKSAIEKLLAYLPYSAKFVPFSQSRHNGEKTPSINWRVTLGRLTTDYSQGYGHCPAYEKWGYRYVVEVAAVKAECETGYAHTIAVGGQNEPQSTHKRIPGPDLADVVYALVTDASVLDYPDFESWAHEFGYDADSRSAEKTYQECLKVGIAFRSMLRPGHFEQLQTLCQDM
jgi:hypothetical protein